VFKTKGVSVLEQLSTATHLKHMLQYKVSWYFMLKQLTVARFITDWNVVSWGGPLVLLVPKMGNGNTRNYLRVLLWQYAN